MEILVCVKQVPAAGEVPMKDGTFTLDRAKVENVLNPFDGCALETALRLRESVGGRVSVVTMGRPECGEMLRALAAIGGDAFYLISDSVYAGADALATAQTLARAVRFLGGFDLILCGERTTDGETGQVGPMLAATLKAPFVGGIRAVEKTEDGQWRCRMGAEDEAVAVMAAEQGKPLVAAVTRCCTLRYPSLMGLRRKADIQRLSAEQLGAPAAVHTRVVRVERQQMPRRQTVWYADSEEGSRALLQVVEAENAKGELAR